MTEPTNKTKLSGILITQRFCTIFLPTTLVLLFTSIPVLKIHSQMLSPSVVVSSGNSDVGSNCIIDWTLGQIADETYSKTAGFLCQGFQQTFISSPVQTEEIPADSGIILFPNPVSKILTIQFPQETKDIYTIMLYNSEGKLAYTKQLIVGIKLETLNVSNYPPGIYWLIITSSKGSPVKTFKFIKH